MTRFWFYLSFGGKLASLDVHVDTGKVISLPCWWHHVSRF